MGQAEDLTTEFKRGWNKDQEFVALARDALQNSGLYDATPDIFGENIPTSESRVASFLDLLDSEGYPFQQMASRVLLRYSSAEITPETTELSPETMHHELRSLLHPIHKTHGSTDAVFDIANPNNPINGVIVNTMEAEPAKIWTDLATGQVTSNGEIIPVAPLLLRKEGTPRVRYHVNGNATAISRFCGPDLETLRSSAVDIVGLDDGNEVGEILPKGLRRELTNKVQHISDQLDAIGISHNHFTRGNLTYELVKKKWIQSELEKGKNINTMEYDPNSWSFDIRDKISDPEEWELVVRLIDFDIAKHVGEGDWPRNIMDSKYYKPRT